MIQNYLSVQVLTLKFRVLSEWELVLAWIYMSAVFDPIEIAGGVEKAGSQVFSASQIK